MPIRYRTIISALIILLIVFLYSPFTIRYSNQVQAQEQRNMAVSAVVPPNQNDFQFTFAATDNKTAVAQNEILSYEITYGAYASGGVSSPTTIVVDFSDDLAPNSAHVLDYVIGSASNAYNTTPPVINLAARTITWTIPSLPPGTTDQKLSFQLQTNENYTGTSTVSFITRSTMQNDYLTMPEQTVSQSYTFNQALVTPTPAPTATPEPTQIPPTETPGPPRQNQPSSAPTPTTAVVTKDQNAPSITDIFFTDIGPTSANITVITNQPTNQFIRYGTSPQSLSQTQQASQFGTMHTYQLTNLSPATTYYFQLVTRGADNVSRTSEIFTFTTAARTHTPQPSALNRSITISTDNAILLSQILTSTKDQSPLLLMHRTMNYQIAYSFERPVNNLRLTAVIRNQSGIVQEIPLQAQNATTFTGSLRSGSPGFYTIVIRQQNSDGSLHEQQVALVRVLSPLRVVDSSGNPISDARLFFSVYNPSTKKYEALTDDRFKVRNPFFTDRFGEAILRLPQGNYRVRVSALGYNEKTVTFSLGKEPAQDFPRITLEANPFSLSSLALWLQDMFQELISFIKSLFSSIFNSNRVFLFVSIGTVISFIALSIALFVIRTQIRWRDLFPFFVFHVFALKKKDKDRYLSGMIMDTNKLPLANVILQVINPSTHEVLGHAMTNTAGHFKIRNNFNIALVSLLCTRDGFTTHSLTVETTTHEEIKITLQQHVATLPGPHALWHLAGSLFEVSLLLSLIMELCFFATFGLVKTLPFLFLTGITALLWLFYLKEHERKW